MGYHCIAPGCKSGYDGQKCHFFLVPKGPKLIALWQKAIFRDNVILEIKNPVCEKHFRPDNVIWTSEVRGPDGTVMSQFNSERTDKANQSALNNPMTVKELTQKYPSIEWKEYFNTILKGIIEIDDDEVIIVQAPTYFKNFETLIKETPKRVLNNYRFWKAAQESSYSLTEEVVTRGVEFDALISGQVKSEERLKECLETSALMGLGTGALYVREYFNPESKKSAEELVVDIENQLMKNLKEVEWMDEKTRTSALDKLESLKDFIGYLAELLDDKTLNEYYEKLEITSDDYLRATQNLTAFTLYKTFSQLRKPINQSDWTFHRDSSNVNGGATYSQSQNSIDIPAGILQEAFFSEDRLRYLNYAGIGPFNIVHGIMHSIDNEGRQFDKNGDLDDWWTPETKTKFLPKADCIIQQYGNYTVEGVDLKGNGTLSQGSNIADNGGVKISYLAYQDWVRNNGPEPILPGLNYSQSQLFWIQAAVIQCEKFTPEVMKNFILTNDASPGHLRVTGAFSNRPEFARDFNCPVGSTMNPVKKCSVF